MTKSTRRKAGMRTLGVVAAAAVATAAFTVPAFALLSTANITVSASGFSGPFSSTRAALQLGGTADWSFTDQSAQQSVQFLPPLSIDSGPQSAGTTWPSTPLAFNQAGTFDYQDGTGTYTGTAKIRVAPTVSPSTGTPSTAFTITFETGGVTTPSGDDFAVQDSYCATTTSCTASWAPIVGSPTSTNSSLNFTPNQGTGTYSFRVRLEDTVNSVQSGWSPAVTVSVTSVPGAPTSLTATPSNGQVALSWTAPTGDGGSPVTGYNVYRSTTSGSFGTTPLANVTSGTSYVDSTVKSATTYYYEVTALNANGESAPSTPPTSVVTNGAPGAPGSVTATAGNASATVTWTAPASNGSPVIGYRVTDSPGGTIQNVAGTSATFKTLQNGTAYTFSVTAQNAVGFGPVATSNAVVPTAPTVTPTTVAVTGTNHAVFVRSAGGWTSLGGYATSGEAVVYANGTPLVLVTGGDHNVWIRSMSSWWSRFTPAAYCLGRPGAAVYSGSLYVACQGANHQVYAARAPLTGGVPHATGWAALGGSATSAPAVGVVGGQLVYVVAGPNDILLSRTASSGWTQLPWASPAAPALATSSSGTAYLAFHGTNRELWYATSTGGAWSSATALGGVMVAGPGIAALPSGPAFYVEGTDGGLYERTPTTNWSNLGGHLLDGAAAAAG